MLKRIWVLTVALLWVLALAGCSSNLDSSGRDNKTAPQLGEDPLGNRYVGAVVCIDCHEGFSWSEAIVAGYLGGKHVVHSDHITAGSEAECLGCHDPVGDGPYLEELVDPADVPDEGLAAVGCENCHGGGGEHYGVGPMPDPRPGPEACAQCHDALPESHYFYHPEARDVSSNYALSRHATARVRDEAVCSKCHTDEGGRAYKNVNTVDALNTVVMPVENGSPVQCRTCHDPHEAGKLLKDDEEDRGNIVASAEYATCVTCHMGENDDPAELLYHGDRHMRTITDTHYDDPATSYENGNPRIEGYVVVRHDENGQIRACLDCHDVHGVMEIRADRDTSTISDQWAASAHAGRLLIYKKEELQAYADMGKDGTVEQTSGMKKAGPDGEQSSWPHYDWDAGDRQSCQRCHTSTGAKNFMAGPDVYVPADNDFSHLAGWENAGGAIASSGQNELLYCWGCHSDNSGGLRDPGPITEQYDPAVVIGYPDIAGSNVCMSCHLGREVGEVIAVDMDADGVRSFINSHYLAAGAELFAVGGYEYTGRNYSNVTYFKHDLIGTEALPATGGNGPCVACHMSSSDSHSFLAVEVDDTTGDAGEITAPVCFVAGCHPGLAPSELQVWKDGYAESLHALEAALESVGIYFLPQYPYFFVDVNGDGEITDDLVDHDGDPGTDPVPENDRENGYKDWAGVYGLSKWKETMGAAFNYNLLEHDPGGYAHNGFYTKGLIWDSIDFLYDGELNGDVVDALNDLGLAPETIDGALDYLGTSRPGDASRP